MPAPDDTRLVLALAQAEASPDGLLVVSPGGRILFHNHRFAELWELADDALVPADDDVALQAALRRVRDPEAFLARVRRLYAERTAGHDELELRDGRIIDRTGAPLFAPDGRYVGYAWYFRDVTVHRRAERELRELASTLQASLLPPRPPEIPGMEVATHYRPAEREILVGGDFFDVFRVAVNDWAVGIGDVCGKGARAASLTAHVRYALRAAAVHTRLPSDALHEVNSVLVTEPDDDTRFCSVAFARVQLDTCGAWVTLATAGHPRPIVVRRAGWIDLRGQPGTPLGMFPRAEVSDDRVGLGPGDAIVLFTDGVTEARDDSGAMFGEEALPHALLDAAGQPAAAILEHVVSQAAAFAGGRAHDDVAVVVLRVPDDGTDPIERLREATGASPDELDPPARVGDEYAGLRTQRPLPPREARIRLPRATASARAARRFAAGVLHSWRMSELVGGDVELLASEVAANAVRHGEGDDYTVILRYDGTRLRVEVGDGSRALPTPLSPAPDAVSGRGLFLVESLASDWGVAPTVDGKRVWFELPAHLPATGGGVSR